METVLLGSPYAIRILSLVTVSLSHYLSCYWRQMIHNEKHIISTDVVPLTPFLFT